MKTLVVVACLCLTLSATATHAVTPVHVSSQRYGGSSLDECSAIVTDASGNVYMTGYFNTTVNFGGAPLISLGSNDIFLVKFNSSGVHQWSMRFGAAGFDVGNSVALDPAGNVYVTGYFAGTVNFGGANLVSTGFQDTFLAKFNSSGAHVWSKRFGGNDYSVATDVAVSLDSDVFLTGWFRGTTNFGGSDLVSAGFDDIVVAKYNSTGVHQWSKRAGSGGNDDGFSLFVDTFRIVRVTGAFDGAVDFGGGILPSAGSSDIFVASFSGFDGAHIGSKRFGSTQGDAGYGIVSDPQDNFIVTGTFQGNVSFGGTPLGSSAPAMFVAKFSYLGLAHQWSVSAQSSAGAAGSAVAVDPSGDIYVTGNFSGYGVFEYETAFAPIFSAGGSDAFLSRLSGNGVYHWTRTFGGPSNDFGRSVAFDGLGRAIVGGSFQGTGAFGPVNLVSAGSTDIFLVKYNEYTLEPLITSITDIGNDQGRKVKIRFDRSANDLASVPIPVTRYVALRRDDPAPALMSAETVSSGPQATPGWTEVGWVSAFSEDSYGIDAPTIGDSTVALGAYNSMFIIRAATAATSGFYDSRVSSGYSLDNLAPDVPLNFVYDAGDLSWNESTAADFDFFTVYGSNTDSFGAATVVDYSIATAMDVSASPYVFYYVTATDFSGNEGKPAKINSLTGAGGTPTSYVLSVSNYPNPFNPRTTVSYTVPSRGRVTIAVYDARGAFVATLFDGDRSAGAYSVDWDGRAAGASVAASGVYFARIEHASGTRAKKMVLLK